MVRYPIEERIGQVDVPLLLLRGEHDHVAPRPWVEHLTALAKDGRFVEVEGAGHGVIDDHRDEVAARFRGDATLPLVGRAAGGDLGHAREFVGAAELACGRFEAVPGFV